MGAVTGQPRVVVAVLSYRRPAMLRRLLPLLEQEVALLDAGRVLVIDNDPARSAAAIVTEHGGGRTHYVAEPEPGISAGRNRALAEARDDDVLVFIDDDERPESGWLAALLDTWSRTGAAGVAGPVVSEFAAEPDPFVVDGGFFDREHRRGLRTGTLLRRAATNNLLLDLLAVRNLGLSFDPALGLSGGEDSLFTGRLVQAGEHLVWCAEAVVVDTVPADRLTRSYVLRRTRVLAQTGVLAELRLARGPRERAALRVRTLAREPARAAASVASLFAGTLSGDRRRRARSRRGMARARGALAGTLGHVPTSYGAGAGAAGRSR